LPAPIWFVRQLDNRIQYNMRILALTPKIFKVQGGFRLERGEVLCMGLY